MSLSSRPLLKSALPVIDPKAPPWEALRAPMIPAFGPANAATHLASAESTPPAWASATAPLEARLLGQEDMANGVVVAALCSRKRAEGGRRAGQRRPRRGVCDRRPAHAGARAPDPRE